MMVMSVEVNGGEEEYPRGGRDESVTEDHIPVSEVVEQAPVLPLGLGQQEVVHLHRQSAGIRQAEYLNILPDIRS